MKLISVKDVVAAAFLQPITVRTSAEAIRLFENQIKEPTSQFAKNPSDFILYEIADFNELTGTITPLPQPHSLATASQFIS